jgi:S1-C subfamily serine protease
MVSFDTAATNDSLYRSDSHLDVHHETKQPPFNAAEIFAQAAPSIVRLEKTVADRHFAGTGFFVSSGQPHSCEIATNDHVVRGDAELPTVTTHDGKTYQATLEIDDPEHDLAVYKLLGVEEPEKTCRELPLSTTQPVAGMPILAIGADSDASKASAEEPVFRTGHVLSTEIIQTPASGIARPQVMTMNMLTHGYSGGPQIDAAGKVVAINEAVEAVEAGVPSSTRNSYGELAKFLQADLDSIKRDEAKAAEIFAQAVPSVVKVSEFAGNSIREGTGFFVSSDQPHSCEVVISPHVTQGAESARITTHDGLTYQAIREIYDPQHDLAVYKLQGVEDPEKICRELPLRTTEAVAGEPVFAIDTGAKGASVQHPVFHTGRVISTLMVNANARFPEQVTMPMLISTDMSAPGYSGGPEIDAAGKVMSLHEAGGNGISQGVLAKYLQADFESIKHDKKAKNVEILPMKTAPSAVRVEDLKPVHVEELKPIHVEDPLSDHPSR